MGSPLFEPTLPSPGPADTVPRRPAPSGAVRHRRVRRSGLPAQLPVVQFPLPTPILLDVGSLLRVPLGSGARSPLPRSLRLGAGVRVLRLGAHGAGLSGR